MANLDSRFICTSDLELLLRDNASGLPLSGGIVTFYSDVNRTVLKPVYQLTGTPGNYTYSPLPNPCVLSSAGTFQDALGNNIIPYYYPFTSTPAANTGVQELYYIVVQNSGLVPQFTRQGWPQAAAGSGVTPLNPDEVINFIPNGQFLAHNAAIAALAPGVEPYVQYTFGAETLNAQPIAQGGWNFVYDDGTTATFMNSFSSMPTPAGWGLTSYPRFAFNFECLSIGDTPLTRDLRIQWPNVYTFSAGGSPTYNLFFNAVSNDVNTYVFTVWIIYYFGAGGSGSTQTAVPMGTISIGRSYSSFNLNVNFTPPAGTLGNGNDDYVAISLRGPTTSWNVQLTDFSLTLGAAAVSSFPTDPNATQLSQGVAGWMPTPDAQGQDLYLPLILTPQGMTFDHSQVGRIVSSLNLTTTSTNSPALFCDGTGYLTNGYSVLGIPYSRLQAVLFDSASNGNLFGTGPLFVESAISSGATSQLIINTNQGSASTQTAPADGTPTTGFNFTTSGNGLLNAPAASSYLYGYEANSNSGGYVTAISTAVTPMSAGFVDTGSTGISFVNLSDPLSTGEYYGVRFLALAASSLANGSSAGKYFTFYNGSTFYAMWFHTASETAPTPSGSPTVLRCNLIATMTAEDVANVIAATLNGFQTNTITTAAASGFASSGTGSNWTFYSNSTQYTVWYNVASGNTAPVVLTPLTTLIQVNVGASDNAATVATETQKALNTFYVAVPDARGVFLRGFDPTQEWDIDEAYRWSKNSYLNPVNLPGTFEFDIFSSHDHSVGSSATGATANSNAGNGQPNPTGSFNTGYTGGSETRPVNLNAKFWILY